MTIFLTLLLAGIIFAGLFLVSKYCSAKISKISILGTLLVFLLLVQFRYCMSDSFVFVINGKAGLVNFDGRDIVTSHDYLQSFLRWGLGICSIVSIVGVYCKNKFFKNMSLFICLPIALIATINVESILDYLLSRKEGMLITYTWENATFRFADWIHKTEFILELALCIVLPLIILLIQKHRPFKDKKEIFDFFIFLIPCALMCMPMYVPQSLFGFTSITIAALSEDQLIYVLCLIFVTATLYVLFRRRSYEDKYALMFFFCLTATQFYTQMFTLGHSWNRIAFFQLCNLGNYLLLICIIFKKQGLFDFILLANTLGAIIAFLVPDISAGLFEAWNFHFMYEHSLLLVTPILLVGFNIFKRPDKKAFKHAFIGYCIFFGACFTMGTIINLIHSIKIQYFDITANYFYMFNVNKILDVVKFMRWTTKVSFKVCTYYVVYPVWLILFFLTYLFGIFLMNKVMNFLFGVADEHIKLRNHRIQEKRELGKKVIARPYYKGMEE